jgi:hypothetical protein
MSFQLGQTGGSKIYIKEVNKMMENKRSESIPLTFAEMREVGKLRLSKQYSKRILLVLGVAFVIAIIGLAAFASIKALGVALVVIAVLGFCAGVVWVSHWWNQEAAKFAKDHKGSFYKVEKES